MCIIPPFGVKGDMRSRFLVVGRLRGGELYNIFYNSKYIYISFSNSSSFARLNAAAMTEHM